MKNKMLDVRRKRVSVIGYGRSGLACAELLVRMGAKVFVSEIKQEGTPCLQPQFAESCGGVEFEFGEHTERIYEAELIVVSPGVPVTHPIVLGARKRSIPVIGELELASRFIDNRMIGITGTNGKTTTVFLIQKLLEFAQIDAVMCGNVGVPLSSVVGKIGMDTVLVVEVSSFQLETIETFRPWVGVILNITADHFDRHKDFDEYRKLKFRLFSNQIDSDFAVLNLDDPNIVEYWNTHLLKAQVQGFKGSRVQGFKGSLINQTPTVWIEGDDILWKGEKICSIRDLNITWECWVPNYLVAIIVGKIFNLHNDLIINGLKGFKGVPHRLELVGVVNGVKFINNSMCTNPAAFASSLYSFPDGVGIVLIAGGKRKNVDIAPIVCAINEKAKYVLLIGETSKELSRLVKAKHRSASSLEEAVNLGYEQAEQGDAVLLSPGFASFDWFRDFSERGEKFKQAVKKLKYEKER